MLFGDHDGRTEEEIKGEIKNRGGRRNGITYSDHVSYYATISKEHGLLALDWIYRIVQPHAMEPEVVDRGRQPVALEIGVRPRELFDWIGAYVIDPPWLRVKGFWEREFNYETRKYRWYDRYATLQSITPEDLRAFYETYYVPSRMTLVVVDDLDRDTVLAQAEATFGTLPTGPEPEVVFDVVDPDRQHRSFSWAFQSSVLYNSRFKIYDLTSEQHLRMIFIQQMLQYRLNQRLRYGERKAVYGISVFIGLRGPTAYLQISARINDDGWESSYAEWLKGSRISAKDAVVILSVGGGDPERRISLNLVRAVETAKAVGAGICGIVGREGGVTARSADACVIVPQVSVDRVTPHTESFQSVVLHLLVSHPRLQTSSAKWESLK